MDIYQLQVFLAVYRNRSFTAAAKELHLSQPSVSAHVRKLEEELGVRLFDKVGRRTVPTDEGIRLSGRAEEIIARISELKSDLRQSGGEVAGIISIGACGIPGSYVLPPLAAGFSRQHPEVFFQIVIDESKRIAERVRDGELLIGVIDEAHETGALESLHRFQDELVLVAAPGFLTKKTITPLGLFRIPLLMREEGSEARTSMEKQHLLHKISLKALNIRAIMGSTDSVREAVKAGLGAAILSRFVVRDDLAAGLVEEIRVRGVRMKREFRFIARRNRTIPDHYRSFVRFLKTRLAASSGSLS